MMVMCGSPTFDLHGALHTLSDLAAEIELTVAGEEGAPVVMASANVKAKEISIQIASAQDLRLAHRRLGITETTVYGDVQRPLRSGTVDYDGWTVVVYGPAGLTAVK